MLRLFLVMTLLIFSTSSVHAQANSGEEEPYVQILSEDDYEDISELHKLKELIPASEQNCYRVEKNKKKCRCESGYLYNEYTEVVENLSDRHPEWGLQKEITYSFFWEGFTYEGTESIRSFNSYTDMYRRSSCATSK